MIMVITKVRLIMNDNHDGYKRKNGEGDDDKINAFDNVLENVMMITLLLLIM